MSESVDISPASEWFLYIYLLILFNIFNLVSPQENNIALGSDW